MGAADATRPRIAPVKPEYLRQRGTRTVIEAVTGTGQSPHDAAPKSRRQLQKERAERQKESALCHSLLRGDACPFGDQCRFSHDVAAFLQRKGPELPGQCPFLSTGTCAYGIACVWASSHRHDDTAARLLRAANPESNGHATVNGVGTRNPAGAELTSQQTSAFEQSADLTAVGDEQTDSHAGSPAAAEAANGAESLPVSMVNGSASRDSEVTVAPMARAARPLAIAVAASELPVNGLRPEPLVLPAPECLRPELNSLDRDQQVTLRRGKYDFGRADAVLKSLNVTSGRHTTSVHKQRSPSLGHTVASPVDAINDAAQVSPQPTAEPAANGHGAAADPRTAEDRGTGESQGVATATAEDDGAAVRVATKRLRLHMDTEDGHHMNGHSVAHGPPSLLPDPSRGPESSSEAATDSALVFNIRASKDQIVLDGAGIDAPLRPAERRRLDLVGKLYLAPLTTVGNLPFRYICKGLGADITCGEMALATNLLQGQASEWALLKRHPAEDVFGVQVCGGYPDAMARCAQVLEERVDVDFVDINSGCPIDLICNKCAGSSLMLKPVRMENIVRSMSSILSCPLTIKLRKGYNDGADIAHELLPRLAEWGAAAATLHGRTRQQRYSRDADWDYIARCAAAAPALPLIGNGDVYNWEEYRDRVSGSGVPTAMIARSALIKPWIFTEIKEERHWDISAGERLELLKRFCSTGLAHWGSDRRGVETTRRFLLEWLSFMHRYIPVGLLEQPAAALTWRMPTYVGRSDLETLFASDHPADWVRISEMLLGPAPAGFMFQPKHKAQATVRSEQGMALTAEMGQDNG